ncbi:hypothetical protein Holit_01954 [Hollandina sp. SP2]
MAKNYIPSRDRDFDAWFPFMNQYVTEKCSGAEPAWPHIPQAVQTQMLNTCSAWYAAYRITLKPCTSQAKAEDRRVCKIAEQMIRPVLGAVSDRRSDYAVGIYYGLSGPANEIFRFRITKGPMGRKDLPYSVFATRKKERFDFDGESGCTSACVTRTLPAR